MKLVATALLSAVLLLAPAAAQPLNDANRALDEWSSAYTASDVEAVVGLYWPDATLFGAAEADLATGHDAIRKHFAAIKGVRVQNRIGQRHPLELGPNAVLITGYYEFLRVEGGKTVESFARFTFMFTKRGDKWGIAHHHSSPYPEKTQ